MLSVHNIFDELLSNLKVRNRGVIRLYKLHINTLFWIWILQKLCILWKLIGICNDVWNHIQLLKCLLWKFIFLYTIYVCIYYFSLISLWLANGLAQFKCVRFMGMKPSMHWKHNLYATLNWNAKFLIVVVLQYW